jgi:hypothetical protein
MTELEKKILKVFKGKYVSDYPAKGKKLSQSETVKNPFGNGEKPQNPSLVSEQ